MLADAIEAKLPPREDRDPDARLFVGVTADRLRTAIARACRAAGVPVFSPHDLRHRRISLLHAQGRTWAEIGRFVGQRKLSITSDTYTHVLSDGAELDYWLAATGGRKRIRSTLTMRLAVETPFASDHVHATDDSPDAVHDHGHGPHRHGAAHGHGHSHGLVDRSIMRSRAGVRAVSVSLAVLGLTAVAQAALFVLTDSVALLADLIHNAGDALTAIPLGIAFLVRSSRAETAGGYLVVLAIAISAAVALYETVARLLNPKDLSHLWVLAAAGALGFAGNEIAAQVRLRAGRRLASPALVADGNHARVDAYVSLGVIASAALVALGLELADPLVGLAITLVILRITWDSWRTIRAG